MRILLVLFILGSKTFAEKNILLICIDDLRPELKSFGVD